MVEALDLMKSRSSGFLGFLSWRDHLLRLRKREIYMPYFVWQEKYFHAIQVENHRFPFELTDTPFEQALLWFFTCEFFSFPSLRSNASRLRLNG